MKSITIILFFFLFTIGEMSAQQSTMQGKKVIYRKEYGIGGGLTTSGFNLSVRKGKIRNVHITNFYEMEFANFKHNKEMRMVSERDYGTKYFVYGKKNDFFNLRAGVGRTKRIFEKSESNGVQVAYSLMVGPSLGLIKPYYLFIGNPQYDEFKGREVYVYADEKYDENVLPENNHYLNMERDWVVKGPSGLSKGMSELNPLPGGYVKFGLNFEFANFYDQVRMVEIGGVLDLYAGEIPVMIITKNKPYNVSLYLNIYFGSRKTH